MGPDLATNNSYHFFGDLWLENPEAHLSTEELEKLRSLEPLIRQLERRREEVSFDLQEEFRSFVDKEVAVWKGLGVERSPKFLLHPSGDMDSTVACHLHNPTFYVKDPDSRETDNDSNPSIRQLHQAGFSSKNCLLFDDICRRDRTEDVEAFYTEDLICTHREFTLSVRKAMSAKVEVCFGKRVFERMREYLNLVSLKLWGEYKGVELFLEIENSAAVRLILFVYHPQFFFYHGQTSERALLFRKKFGRRQDLHLSVAGKLGGIQRTTNFYESKHVPHHYGQFDNASNHLVKWLEEEADHQLRVAFPEKYKKIETGVRALAEKANIDRPTPAVPASGLTTYQLLSGDNQEYLRRERILINITASLIGAIQQSFGGVLSLRTTVDDECLPSLLSDWIEVDEFDQIPRHLLLWIQSQDGLKIDRNPISSVDDLFLAYQLLSPLKQEPRKPSLIEISLKVATWYLPKAKKHRWNSVQSLMFPAVSPHNIMRRKCLRCGKRVLDDPFACFAIADATKYITWYRSGGCGRPDCQVLGNAELVPASPFQEYRMARQEALQCLRSADWKDYLLLSPLQTLNYLPQTVETCCPKCQERWLDMRPRWTTEKFSRYVKRVRKCTKCGEQSPFAPKDNTITSMAQSFCSKKWRQLKKAGVDPAAYQCKLELLWTEARKEAKSGQSDAILSDPDQPQKRRRIFNSKSRANRDRKK